MHVSRKQSGRCGFPGSLLDIRYSNRTVSETLIKQSVIIYSIRVYFSSHIDVKLSPDSTQKAFSLKNSAKHAANVDCACTTMM